MKQQQPPAPKPIPTDLDQLAELVIGSYYPRVPQIAYHTIRARVVAALKIAQQQQRQADEAIISANQLTIGASDDTIDQLQQAADTISQQRAPRYTISLPDERGRRSITCHTCLSTSYHPGDVDRRYCKRCARFHDDDPASPREGAPGHEH